jgi:hypothetical protein
MIGGSKWALHPFELNFIVALIGSSIEPLLQETRCSHGA